MKKVVTYHRLSKERSFMPYKFFNLQLFGEEGTDMAGSSDGSVGIAADNVAVNPSTEGVATGGVGDQVTPETVDAGQPGESWKDLIKGKYKKEYDESVKAAVNKRFKNQQNLQSQIDSIDPLVRMMAQKYGVQPNPDGSIPIDQLQAKLDADNSMYEQEAFQRGMSVDDLRQMKQLERENMQLRRESQRTQEQRDWDEIVMQGEALKQMYPQFDLDAEMQNENFGRLLATFRRSNFPNAVQTAYEAVHRDEIMGGAMRYAVKQTETKLSNAIQSGMNRPQENGVRQTSSAFVPAMDPSNLTKEQLDDIKRRAERGERITF